MVIQDFLKLFSLILVLSIVFTTGTFNVFAASDEAVKPFVLWSEKDGKEIPKIHPSQKPVALLKKLIETFTDEGDVVIDPCCGSGTTLRAAVELGRSAYGFEIDRNFYNRAKDEMLDFHKDQMDIFEFIEK